MTELTTWDYVYQAIIDITPMQVALVLALSLFGALIYAFVKNPHYKNFRLIHMVSNTEGFPDDHKLRAWGVYFLSSYAFLWLLWHDKFTEWFFIGYMGAWVGAAAYAMKKRVESDTEPPSSTTSSIETIEKRKTVSGKK